MSKPIKTGDTKLFEVRLVVAYHDYTEDESFGATEWLLNLLSMAERGENIETGARMFLASMLALEETELCLHKTKSKE